MKTLSRIFATTVGVMALTAGVATVSYPFFLAQPDTHEAIVKLSSDYLTSANASPPITRPFLAILSGEF